MTTIWLLLLMQDYGSIIYCWFSIPNQTITNKKSSYLFTCEFLKLLTKFPTSVYQIHHLLPDNTTFRKGQGEKGTYVGIATKHREIAGEGEEQI